MVDCSCLDIFSVPYRQLLDGLGSEVSIVLFVEWIFRQSFLKRSWRNAYFGRRPSTTPRHMRHTIKDITLSKTSHYQRYHTIKDITLSKTSHYQRHHTIKYITLFLSHIQTYVTLSNATIYLWLMSHSTSQTSQTSQASQALQFHILSSLRMYIALFQSSSFTLAHFVQPVKFYDFWVLRIEPVSKSDRQCRNLELDDFHDHNTVCITVAKLFLKFSKLVIKLSRLVCQLTTTGLNSPIWKQQQQWAETRSLIRANDSQQRLKIS